MKNYYNIECKKFHGYYVGYSKCGIWHIHGNTGAWSAYLKSGQLVTNMAFAPVLHGSTLAELSKKLERI